MTGTEWSQSVVSTRPQTKKEKEKMGEVIVESNGRDGLVCVKCFISLTMVLFCFAFVGLQSYLLAFSLPSRD